jgi:hypothetical protein
MGRFPIFGALGQSGLFKMKKKRLRNGLLLTNWWFHTKISVCMFIGGGVPSGKLQHTISQ